MDLHLTFSLDLFKKMSYSFKCSLMCKNILFLDLLYFFPLSYRAITDKTQINNKVSQVIANLLPTFSCYSVLH